MNTDQWSTFRRKFPAAASWMDAVDLANERERLTSEQGYLEDYRARVGRIGSNDEKRLAWVKSRLAELNLWHKERKAS